MDRNESIQASKRHRGGQPGNTNAVKHGFYTKGGRERFEKVDTLIQECNLLLKAIADGNHTNL